MKTDFIRHTALQTAFVIGSLFFPIHANARDASVYPSEGQTPVPVIATGDYEYPCSVSSDGNVLRFLRVSAESQGPAFSTATLSGSRSQPSADSRLTRFRIASASVSPDGTRLFFASVHPLPDSAPNAPSKLRLWSALSTSDGWSDPIPLGPAITTSDGEETSPSVASDGTLYFCSSRSGGRGGWDIYRSRFVDGDYITPELVVAKNELPGANGWRGGGSTATDETSVTVSPDGSFIVFAASGRQNCRGESDLYYAECAPGEGCSNYTSLGSTINTQSVESNPVLSPDGKALFFNRDGDIYRVALQGDDREPEWLPCAPMPRGQAWARAIYLRGKIYVGGGESRKGQKLVDEYDPVTDRWRELPEVPEGWNAVFLGALGEKLLLFRVGANDVARYDFERDVWVIEPSGEVATPSPKMPGGALYTVRLAGDGARLFCAKNTGIGSSTGGYVMEYALARRAWQPLPVMPTPTAQIGLAGNALYAIGAGGKRVEVLDLASGRWSRAPDRPMGRAEIAMTAHNEQLWCVGGHDSIGDDHAFRAVNSFDPVRGVWTERPSLPRNAGRFAAAAVVAEDTLYVFGGAKHRQLLTSVYRLKLPPR